MRTLYAQLIALLSSSIVGLSSVHGQLSDCSVSPGNHFEYVDQRGWITYIYEEASNASLESPGILAKKNYRYIPPIQIKEVKILPGKQDSTAFIKVVFSPKLPALLDLASFLKKEANPYIRQRQIRVACLEGYSIRYPFGEFKEEGSGGSLNNDYSIFLDIPEKHAEMIFDDFRQGTGIELRFLLLMKYACNNRIDVTATLKSISETSRDFEQKVKFKDKGYDISGMQKFFLERRISRMLRGKILIDCELNLSSEKILETLSTSVIQLGNEKYIAFEELEKEDALIDINGDSYRPDLLKRIAFDVKQKSDEEFHQSYTAELENKKVRRSETDAKGGFSIVKIFSANGGGKKKTEQEDQWKSVNQSEKDFKKMWEESFSYEWEGEKWTPKGIKVYDKIGINTDDKTEWHYAIQQFLRQHRAVKPFIISK